MLFYNLRTCVNELWMHARFQIIYSQNHNPNSNTVFPRIVAANFNFLPNKLNFCCGNYSKAETIQGQKQFKGGIYSRKYVWKGLLFVDLLINGWLLGRHSEKMCAEMLPKILKKIHILPICPISQNIWDMLERNPYWAFVVRACVYQIM